MRKPFTIDPPLLEHGNWAILDADGVIVAYVTTKARADMIRVALNKEGETRLAGVP